MAMSSGVRQAVGMAAGWVAVSCMAAFGFLYYAEIKSAVHGTLGLGGRSSHAAEAGREPAPARGPYRAAGGSVVELKAGSFGHYRTEAEINGRPVSVLVDSGASIVVLTYEDAERAGIYVRERDYTQRVSTANGVTRVAPMTLDRVSIGGITVRDVEAAVSEPGRLGQSLLGMTFLGRLQRVDMRPGVLVLQD